jgi:uncharacterized protein YoxC
MTPLAQAIVVICVVVVSAALVAVCLALRRTATRAEIVLQLVEREIRPLASQVVALGEDIRALSRQTSREIERVGTAVDRVGEMSAKIAHAAALVGSFTRVGQMAAVATGVRKGLNVFLSRLRDKHS